MAGETQQMHTVKELDAGSKQQHEDTALEHQSDKATRKSSEHFSSTGTEARLGNREANAENIEKERDCPQQREAVIRPQQTGKIDFKSLHNRSKFVTDGTWSSGKGSPQSPSGKGRSREKGKRSGKAERGNPQQLYRLSITSPRTVGIAYPQQKVLPPKKLETSSDPVSSSYRFHVSSMPEREVELQQEELSYSRFFQENPPNITSPNYTSQPLGSSTGTTSHPHPPLSQQPVSMENNSAQTGSSLILTDCQLSSSNAWQSPKRTFNGANYGLPSQKSSALPETSKAISFVPGPFQYGYHLLEQSTSDSFPCEQNPQSQDIANSSLGSVHVTHSSFPFTPGAGQNIAHNSTQFSNEHQPEDRSSYPHPPQSQFIQAVASSIQCPRNLSENSPSSDSSGSSSQQSEQGKPALPESTENIAQADGQDGAITSGSKRNCHSKDTAASQRTLIQGGMHTRNVSQGPGSPMHFPNRTFNNPTVNIVCTNSSPFDKSINNKVLNRIPHSWEGPNKTYLPGDLNTIQYADINEKFQFQSQTATDHKPNSSKSSRMPWQQIRPSSALPSPNRMESSSQISNQKLAYIVSSSDWQDESKSCKNNSLKNLGHFQSNRSDVLSNQRQEHVKHNGNTVSAFKVEINHTKVCESKNKSLYFGLNQALSAAPAQHYNYPPLQVPPLGLMRVSPYESPLPSPVHNPASSSTCSSLSPASTSPVNVSSEDSQISKSSLPHSFYHQPQSKAQLPSDHLNTHPHQFHPDASMTLPFISDRPKDDMMSYLQNNTQSKTAMDKGKGYVDSFGVEHHQPPPSYSAHQLLASSLATANLDQLDVLLTCKQCDQNFNNLASFLGHKQYCAQQTFAHNDLKDVSKMEENHKLHVEPVKAAPTNVSLSRCPSDLHLSLLGLNKNGELMCESDTKGEHKDDPLKLCLFSGPGNLPVPLSELEMEDAKLDRLITEALNGLANQSDNAEIDSSFIDAFVDDDLTTVKTSSSKQCVKTKESMVYESKHKPSADDRSFTQGKYCYDSDVESHKKMSMNLEEDEKINIKKEISHKNSRIALREKTWERESIVKEARKLCKSEDKNTSAQRFLLSSNFSEHAGVKSFKDNPSLRGSAPLQASTSPNSKTAAKESKRKSTGGGTWSKELIHKIVQQKNKLHKLHVKGTKNLQFSLVMERLTPTVQNPAFGEYDYVSDSDDECEPVKIASQGRLNQSSRCKYTYTKQCKWRARSERDTAAWRHEPKESFEMKKSEELSVTPEKHGSHQKLRRRGSRSSTSSDLSTSVSISSDGLNSPKSTDRTDSDSEKKADKTKESAEPKSHDRSTPQKLFKESNTLALTFTKPVKKYNADKAAHSDNKVSAEEPKKTHPEVADPLTSPQKARDTTKNVEKRGSSHAKPKEKLVSHKREFDSTISSERQNLQRTKTEVKPTQSSYTNKTLKVDSHSPTITKETDFNIDRSTKRKREEGSEATLHKLSGSATLEKQSDSVCTVKEAITLVNDLDTHQPASLYTSLMDEVCLSPTESHKDALHLMPYPLDQEQGLMKSPLSFDTSSIFGDLAGFDSSLYSEIPIQKEGFPSLESTADKKEEFVSSFSTFMEHRDWNLMVNPVLQDEISPYKDSSEKTNDKKSDYNHISLSLPDKIIDYSATLNSCVSEDELEIKRIVNELETQLQTTKLESTSLLDQDTSKQLQMSKFSPLQLVEESEEGNGLNVKCPVQGINLQVSRIPSEHFTEPELPWPGTFQFELIGENHSTDTPVPSERAELKDKLHLDPKLKERCAENETLVETKEDILEQRRYTENLMKSLEVISDSIFKKEPIISAPQKPNVNSFTSQQHEETECQITDAGEREDRSEKEAITVKETIPSLPHINERKDEIEFILNESQSFFSNETDPSVCSNQPISSQPAENRDYKAEAEVTSEEDTAANSHLAESARCSSVMTHCPHEFEKSSRDSDAEDNLNKLNKKKDDGSNYVFTEGCEEAEAVKEITHEPVGHPSPPALVDPAQMIGEKIADVILSALEQQSTNDNPDITSSQGAELTVTCPDNAAEEITVETSKQNHLSLISSSRNSSPSKTFSETNMSSEMVVAVKPCSPILVKTNTESCCSPLHDTQSAEGQNNPLLLSQSDGIVTSDSRKMTPFNESLKTDTGLNFESAPKQEEILNVQDIKEHLPVNFMASQQNSPCREAAEESHCIFLNSASSTSPLLLISPQQPLQKLVSGEDLCRPKRFIDQGSENVKSPTIKDDNQILQDAVNNDSLKEKAGTECSLISQLDLGVTECKLSEAVRSSPLPVSSTAEPPEVTDGLEKSDLMYDLKLSPLNYSVLSDEPPQLNQFDYIPISPASKPEENLHTEQRAGECESCDLSINPALIFHQTETETAMALDTNPRAKLHPSDEALKFTCFSLGLTDGLKKIDFADDDVKTSLEAFHDPVEPAEELHIHADLLSKAETEILVPHKASADEDILKKEFSDNLPTSKPLTICENDQMPLPADQSEKQLKTFHQIHKETTQKKTQSSDQQGKVLCEICFMCFRTVPGLKRHKAMKHSVRAEKCAGPQSTTSSHQGTMLIYEASQTTEKKHKDDSQTCFPAKVDGLPEISSSLASKAAETESVLEEVAAEEKTHQNTPLPAKAKKNNKARKNKNSELNPDPFSDELLHLLKTDILQAITPEFKNSTLQELCKSPEGKINDRSAARTEEVPHFVSSDAAFNNTTQTATKEPNALGEPVGYDQFGDTEVMKCVSATKRPYLEVCVDSNVESMEENITGESDETRQTVCSVGEMCKVKGSDDSPGLDILRNVSAEIKCGQNRSPSDNLNPISCLSPSPPSPPSMSPDLRTLLDDDTFSQLFPRDEEAKRKKCQRVYSKRNKRPKLSLHSDETVDYLPPEAFMQNSNQYVEARAEQNITDNQTNHCEFETISIDDAIMLNMCHNGTVKADGKPLPDGEQSDQLGDINALGSTDDKSGAEWKESSNFTDLNGGSSVTPEPSLCKPEEGLSSSSPLPPPASPCAVNPCTTEGPQTFHSIDIQNINTTFQLPDIQFFDSSKEISVAPPPEISPADTESRDDEKPKKVTERRGRKRQDGGMKVKDKQYKCKVCFTWFLTLGELNFHKLSHNPSPPPTCYMCVQRKFSSREQLRDHLREKHAKNKTGIWTCGMCLKEISDVWMYNEHLREHATQFARRGQTQGSMLGLPGSFMQETAVKNFISSIMQQRPSKTNRESSKCTKEQEKSAAAESSEGAEVKLHKTKSSNGGSGKQSSLTPLEVLHKTEAPRSVEMHPNCKDPSRDCHHCGKQFPKPFKLQRHLVVHNLERIFLCHKCPVSYQEAQEFKEHLRRAHGEVDELDSKHTTLYTCELCADVMHVIKKSFICSTCNYTFSKKEQFDRHMEKHLSGGNKIFKFRGVLRPVKVSGSKENECDSPASKKRRLLSDSLPENSSDSGIASLSSLHLSQNPEAQSSKPSVPTADDSTQTFTNGDHSDTNVKTEDISADCSQLAELENCVRLSSAESASPKKEETDLTPSPHKDGSEKPVTEPSGVKEENESVCIRPEVTSWTASKESCNVEEEIIKAKECDTTQTEDKSNLPPASEKSAVSTEKQILRKTSESAKHKLAVDEMNQRGDDEPRHHTLFSNGSKQQVSHGAEQQSSSQMKNNAAPATAADSVKTSSIPSCAKATESTPVIHSKVPPLASATNEDKDVVKPQKRRKEMKSAHILQRLSSPVTQENFAVDSKAKKKIRPSKCANPSLQRKSDGSNEYPVLSSVRDDVVGNKIVSKCKNGSLSLSSKRGLLESCLPRKADIIKKGPLGRSVHSPVSKVSSVPMNNSLNKPRPKMGVRSVESNSYRTAESQNHLLSQLFGQKLTSFKIPLRKDTSESIN
ncbi:zinc finger protein 469 [Nematolebias whitei]|uniref:zinc finger protein 469 n=1 Tax=Nematolebias whitei TaxID=451745 RepID=UPI0018990B3D|nr:zinc finger protein 469 [Nematolebias whitei]